MTAAAVTVGPVAADPPVDHVAADAIVVMIAAARGRIDAVETALAVTIGPKRTGRH
jgi:hypothetical protein